jgi:hypothetical protein
MKHILTTTPATSFSLASLPSALKRSATVLAAVLAASFMTSCERSRAVHVPTPQPDYFVELEPNDSPDFPDFVGILDDRSFLVVDGYVEAIGFDIVDHIEFESDRPIEIDFTLEAFGAFGDVDVSIYDPVADQIVGTFATSGRYETGTLIIHESGRPFQFVIDAFDTNSDWSLELVAYPHACACRTGANLDGPGDSGSDHDAQSDAEAAPLPAFSIRREHEILRLDRDAIAN